MGQLFFKKPLQAAIREGRKRTTIRRWGKPRLRAGQRAYAPGVGWLLIDAVEPVEWERLCEADAAADGFDTRARLVQVLCTLYPDHARDGKRWFLVRFRLETPVPARGRRPARDVGGSLFER